uniref:Glycosyltransferase family 92 protein n=1 Tax=Megaselia scalaris TaxID=36166 RepID=T1GXA6_MEGSC
MWLSSWGYKSEDYQHPYLISCDIPEPLWNKTPVAVSLVENKCDKATNLLKIHNRKPVSGQKEDFAVCVKGLSYQYNDQSVILIEWLETLFEMGVSKVIIYVLNVHPNIWKVLEYYLSLGKIELREHTLSGHGPNIPAFQHDFLYNKVGWKRLQELIPYNDCYYDNLNLYKFIALLDIDELIVPKGHLSTWQQLFVFLQPTLKHKPADIDGYGFRDVLFLDEHHTYENIAPYLRFANTIVRASEHMKVGHGTKSWFSTESILTLHNHYSFNLLSPNRKARNKKWHEVDPNVAQMQHYCFNRNCNKLNSTILDTICGSIKIQ